MRKISLIDIILLIIALALLINLIKPLHEIIGNASQVIGPEPECSFFSEGINDVPIERCCYDLQNTLECAEEGEKLRCYNSKSSERYYLINWQAYRFCRSSGYNVKMA